MPWGAQVQTQALMSCWLSGLTQLSFMVLLFLNIKYYTSHLTGTQHKLIDTMTPLGPD